MTYEGITFPITQHYLLGVIRKAVANQTDTLLFGVGLRKLPFPDACPEPGQRILGGSRK